MKKKLLAGLLLATLAIGALNPTYSSAATKKTTTVTKKKTQTKKTKTTKATEEEMITGKYNKFNKVISNRTSKSDYFDYDWIWVGKAKESITVTKDGLKSSCTHKATIKAAKWKNSAKWTSSFKYGASKWKYKDSTGDTWENKGDKLTKEMTNFGFDFSRFKVKKSKTTKDNITITGVYTLSTDADTLYDIIAIGELASYSITGNINNVTSNVTITLDLKTKAMKKVSIKYKFNGEEFSMESDEDGVYCSLVSFTDTFTFK